MYAGRYCRCVLTASCASRPVALELRLSEKKRCTGVSLSRGRGHEGVCYGTRTELSYQVCNGDLLVSRIHRDHAQSHRQKIIFVWQTFRGPYLLVSWIHCTFENLLCKNIWIFRWQDAQRTSPDNALIAGKKILILCTLGDGAFSRKPCLCLGHLFMEQDCASAHDWTFASARGWEAFPLHVAELFSSSWSSLQ